MSEPYLGLGNIPQTKKRFALRWLPFFFSAVFAVILKGPDQVLGFGHWIIWILLLSPYLLFALQCKNIPTPWLVITGLSLLIVRGVGIHLLQDDWIFVFYPEWFCLLATYLCRKAQPGFLTWWHKDRKPPADEIPRSH